MGLPDALRFTVRSEVAQIGETLPKTNKQINPTAKYLPIVTFRLLLGSVINLIVNAIDKIEKSGFVAKVILCILTLPIFVGN